MAIIASSTPAGQKAGPGGYSSERDRFAADDIVWRPANQPESRLALSGSDLVELGAPRGQARLADLRPSHLARFATRSQNTTLIKKEKVAALARVGHFCPRVGEDDEACLRHEPLSHWLAMVMYGSGS